MTELLKRWAALQPEWCRFAVGHNLVFVGEKDGVLGETVTLFPLTQLHQRRVRGLILAAVIEAIEARGWWWNVGTTLQEPVQAYVQSPERNFRPVRAETPAAALLGAYLAALEAEAAQ